MTDYPHVPAAFINAIAEEGTKAEAVEYLQKQWNETCALRDEVNRLQTVIDRANTLLMSANPDDEHWSRWCFDLLRQSYRAPLGNQQKAPVAKDTE